MVKELNSWMIIDESNDAEDDYGWKLRAHSWKWMKFQYLHKYSLQELKVALICQDFRTKLESLVNHIAADERRTHQKYLMASLYTKQTAQTVNYELQIRSKVNRNQHQRKLSTKC